MRTHLVRAITKVEDLHIYPTWCGRQLPGFTVLNWGDFPQPDSCKVCLSRWGKIMNAQRPATEEQGS